MVDVTRMGGTEHRHDREESKSGMVECMFFVLIRRVSAWLLVDKTIQPLD